MPTPATINHQDLPTIALVGRVNVGKSTLFNKLIEKQKAIVSNIPGTTRTNNEDIILWRGKQIRVIDTGGLSFEDGVPLEDDILAQSEKAIKIADLVLFVVDAKDGLMPQEKELAKRMRRIKTKPVIVVANKVDKQNMELSLANSEFYGLGLGEVILVGASSGRRVGDLLDVIYEKLENTPLKPKDYKAPPKSIRVCLIGKPNVGKSSLFNKLIGEERVIVNDMPHTTREPFDTQIIYNHDDKEEYIVFVDTAGIRRKTKVSGVLERQGITKSIDAIEHSDIVLFVIDGAEPLAQQDMQLGGLIETRGKSVIILLNKWDLAEDTSDIKRKEVTDMVYSYFPHLDFAPILLVSGKTGYKVHEIFPVIMRAWGSRQTVVPVKTLEYFLKQVTKEHKPSRGKGTRHPQILGIRQLGNNPPVLELMIKFRTSLHSSYVNFIKRKMREQFDFFASPIIVKLAKMKR